MSNQNKKPGVKFALCNSTVKMGMDDFGYLNSLTRICLTERDVA